MKRRPRQIATRRRTRASRRTWVWCFFGKTSTPFLGIKTMFTIRKIGLPWAAAVLHAVAAAALETYDSKTIREDSSDAENIISPTETPFISSIAGKGSAATNVKAEWPVVELSAVDLANAVAEGQDAPTID